MICGATSGAGKSTLSAALCRSWARQDLRVAPFKAQNMSNHAAVTADGGEVGRAQAMQAQAAGVPLDRRMNPILMKPTTKGRSHLIVMGDEASTTDAADFGAIVATLRPVVLEALTSLRGEFPWVVAEGAGSAAEINLLERDLVNLPLARAAGVPALLVVDIDRGGAFAAAHGTIDLLPPELRQTVVGIVFNQFRGDATLLDDGIAELEGRSGVPFSAPCLISGASQCWVSRIRSTFEPGANGRANRPVPCGWRPFDCRVWPTPPISIRSWSNRMWR